MIENISVMDKPVEKGKGLSRGMWIAVIGGVMALAAVLFAIPTIRRWSRAERSISAAQVRIGEVTRGISAAALSVGATAEMALLEEDVHPGPGR